MQTSLFGDTNETQTKEEPKNEPEYKVAENDFNNTPHRYILCNNKDSITALIQQLEKQKAFSFDTETIAASFL